MEGSLQLRAETVNWFLSKVMVQVQSNLTTEDTEVTEEEENVEFAVKEQKSCCFYIGLQLDIALNKALLSVPPAVAGG
jgi:hypothetical protein